MLIVEITELLMTVLMTLMTLTKFLMLLLMTFVRLGQILTRYIQNSILIITLMSITISLKPKSANKDSNNYNFISVIPEEYQADLNALQQRWIRQNRSPRQIRYLVQKHLFHMILGYMKIQIQNLWLPNRNSTNK
jgi:hypothetical protein